jgi:predicted protein tyrosine phosphatase
MRSKTAEEIYKDDPRFIVKSAGVSENADMKLDIELLNWADYVVVMGANHVEWIQENFPLLVSRLRIICLDIPDAYWFMDSELVKSIKAKFEDYYRREMVSEGVCP